MNLSKGKNIIVVLEGFGILIISHAVGGYYFSPKLAEVFSKVPLVTIEMLSSSAISPIIAIIYLIWRTNFVPKLRLSIRKETLLYFLSGIVLVWINNFIGMLFFWDKEMPLAKEILNVTTPYYYLNLFLVILWGPALEETLTRGYFFEILRRNWGTTIALLLSSLLFVIFHGMWGTFDWGLLFIFIDSVIFTMMYIEGGLVTSILVHSFVNFYLTYLNM